MYPVYVSAKKIKYVYDGEFRMLGYDKQKLDRYAAQGYDAIASNDPANPSYLVLDPKNIKSAIGNQGTFSRTSADIRYMPADVRERSININDSDADYTGMIVRGEKTIETRDNPTSLKPYIGKRVGLVSTGTGGKAMLVGSAVIGSPKQYNTESEFRKDYSKHRVEPQSLFDIKKGSPKWGFPLEDVRPIDPVPAPAGGIVARKMPEGFQFMPDPTIPGAYSMSGYRVLPGKTKSRMRVYSPTGSLIGIAASTDEAQRIIQRKLR